MLARTTIREIKSSLARYLAIFAIIALGVGFFTGLKMCRPDMVDTADKYLQEHNMYDYEILSSYGIDEDSVKLALNTPGVADAETSMQQDIVVKIKENDETYELVFKAISIPKRINTVNLVEGRMPKKNNECVIDACTTNGMRYELGQTVTLSSSNTENDLDVFKNRKFKIVGKVNSPLYLDYQRGSSNIGNGEISSFFYVNRDAFDVDYSTQMYVKLEGNEDSFSGALNKKIKKYEKPMEDLAKKVTEQRRNTAQQQGRDLLAEKRAEYNAGVAKYNRAKAEAEGKLLNAKGQILSGKNLVNKGTDELRTMRNSLTSNKSQLESAISQLDSTRSVIEQSHNAGLMSDEQYREYVSQLDSQLSERKSQLVQVNDGIAQVDAAIEKVNQARTEANNGVNEYKAGVRKSNSELSKAKAELDRGKAALDDAEAQIAEMETGNSYAMSRDDNTGYSTFENNADIVSNVAKIFPIFFFLVAALVVMTTMTRMIDEQRSQIGVFRALGYKSFRIRNKYLFYSGSASLLGSIVGIFVGCNIFPISIWRAYTMMYDFSDRINILYDWKLGILTTIVALICAMGATWFSCTKEFSEVPAELIRPKAPPAGKKILLEKFTGLWDKLSFFYKVSLRNVFRYKKRFFMMVLGICGCTALLVAGMGIKSSISGVAEHQFGEVAHYDYLIAFNQDMDKDAQKSFVKDTKESVKEYGDMLFVYQGNAEVKINGKTKESTLIASDDKKFTDYMELKCDGKKVEMPGDGEVVMCRKMHDQEGIKEGDQVVIKDGFYKMTATVSGFYDNYIEENMIMSQKAYEKGMGKKVRMKTAFVNAPEEMNIDEIREISTAIAQNDKVATVVVCEDIIEMVDSMMRSMNSIVYVIIICAGLLAFIVLYNLTNINILERIREIATIKVLGFYRKETSQYVFRENVILTAISALIGLPLGKWLLGFVIDNIKIDMVFFLPKTTALDYVIAFVLTFVFTFIVNLAMKKKLNKISMTESLKTVE